MTFIQEVYQVIRREMKMFVTYRTFTALTLVLPMVALLYFVVLLDKGVAKDIPVAILDQDNTPLSRQLSRMIDAAPAPKVVYYVADMLEGEKLMKQGKIDAIVAIPRDLEKDIYGFRQANVVAYINGANATKSGLLQTDIQTVLLSFSSGVEMQTLISQGISEKQADDMMMPVFYEKHILFNPFINYAYYLLPVFLSMILLIFTLLTTIFTFGMEFKNGTAPDWMAAANGNILAAFIGKSLPYTVIFMLMNLFISILMFEFLGLPMQGSRTLILVANLVFVMAYQGIGVLIVALLANLRLSLSVGGGYSVLAFTFSGMTFPVLGMSTVIRGLTYFFPLTYYMEIIIDQAMRGAPAVYSLDKLGLMSLFILLPLPFLPRLKRLAGDPKYWGKM